MTDRTILPSALIECQELAIGPTPREAGVFELAHATWRTPDGKGGYAGGLDADLMKIRLCDIDRAIMAGVRDGLLVNDAYRDGPEPARFVPSRHPIQGSTPSTSASWDGPRDNWPGVRIELSR